MNRETTKENAMSNSHLTHGQRALIKAELELRRQQLDRQLTTHHQGSSRVDHAHDVLQAEGDSTAHADDREVDLALSDLELRELGAVSRALGRVMDEDFGLCSACGVEIPFDRLKVEPHAQRCVPCESKHEHTQRSH